MTRVGDPGYLPYCGRCTGFHRMRRDEEKQAFVCPICDLETRRVNGEDMFDRCAPEPTMHAPTGRLSYPHITKPDDFESKLQAFIDACPDKAPSTITVDDKALILVADAMDPVLVREAIEKAMETHSQVCMAIPREAGVIAGDPALIESMFLTRRNAMLFAYGQFAASADLEGRRMFPVLARDVRPLKSETKQNGRSAAYLKHNKTRKGKR